MAKKSYWQTMSVVTDRDRAVIKSWFAPFINDMTVESADALCDIATDRAKKLRAVCVTQGGVRRVVTLRRNRRGGVVTIKDVESTP